MKTEIVFILDRSGSMAGLESDTIGGYNSMLKKQQAEEGEARITTVLFDDKIELLHDREDIRAVSPITDKDYYVRGCTALLDAVGSSIVKTEAAAKHVAEEYRPDKVLFVITTDGMENSSREFSAKKVKSMIEKKKEEGWEFLFLGANIDAVKTAESIGIDRDRSANYHADSAGTKLNFEVFSEAVSCVRAAKPLGRSWKKRIEADFASRDSER